jgi:hypothetical protein
VKNHILGIKNYKNILATIAIGSIIIFGLLSVFPGFVDAIIVEQVRKSVDESTTSQTLQNDDELRLPLQKNQTYIIDGAIFISETTEFCQIAFTFPQDAVVKLGLTEMFSGAESNIITTSGEGADHCDPIPAGLITVSGTVEMGNTDGDLQLQWSAPLPDTTTTIQQGSFLRADRM